MLNRTNGLAPALPVGPEKDGHARGALSNACGTSVKVNYTTCCGRRYYRWTCCPCPYLPPVARTWTSNSNLVQVLQVRCSWSLIAICPGCPKLLWRTLRRIYCPLNSSKYHPRAKTAWHRQPSLPALDLPIAPCRDRSPAHCAAAKLRATRCATATWVALPATSVCFHSFTQTRPILYVLVDSGAPQSLPRSPFVAGGFWDFILTRPAWARHWALV